MRTRALAFLLVLAAGPALAAAKDCPPGRMDVRLYSTYADRHVTTGTIEQGGGNTYAELTHKYFPPRRIDAYRCIPDKDYILSVGDKFVNDFNSGSYIPAINNFHMMVHLYVDEVEFREFIFGLEKLQYAHILAAAMNVFRDQDHDHTSDLVDNRFIFDSSFGDEHLLDQYVSEIQKLPTSTTIPARNATVTLLLRLALASYADRLRKKYADFDNHDHATFFGALAESIQWANDIQDKLIPLDQAKPAEGRNQARQK